MKRSILIALLSLPYCSSAQDRTDSVHNYLPEITVVGLGSSSDIHQLPEIVGTSIYAGKKNALIVMDNVKGNVLTNNMRQVMAKVPGIQIWENDGSGVQIGIAARGLSPNRSWEFNIRQNGYDIAADPFGYPEAYFNPQLQAVQRIEIVRGHGALQYGPQFGGMVNYILRNGSEINKPFQLEMQQSAGSYGLFNTYNAIGGETKKFHYYAFFDHRSATGWRENSRYFTNSGFGTFTWKINTKFSLTTEIMQAHYRNQQPGGLTDAGFNSNPRGSSRARNWMGIEWTTAALIANYRFDEDHKLNVKLFGLAGNRNSVGFLRPITLQDIPDPITGEYTNRTIDIDRYRNGGLEIRYLGDYAIRGKTHTFSAGARYFRGVTSRFRDGAGTAGNNYDLGISGKWPRDFDFVSYNVAAFAENIFRISDAFILIPGVRYEWIAAEAGGIHSYTGSVPNRLTNQQRRRGFLLAGIGAEYHDSEKTEWYANITQAYRPMQFADLTAPPTTNEVDPNLRDARGYNADIGYRGRIGSYLFFDASLYYLRYNNRIGILAQQRLDGTFYQFTTNVGNSSSKGLEALVEFNPVKAFWKKKTSFDFTLFASYAFNDARYGDLQVVQRSGNALVKTNLRNRRVENAPRHILRSGMTLTWKGFSLTPQVSYVGKVFSDANNTLEPLANGQNGVIPAYTVVDLTATYLLSKKCNLRAGMNNLTNNMYFTRRAGGYPGPGILPADGRNFFVTLGMVW